MSRYTILILLNAPLISAALLNALVSYKLNRSSKKRFILRSLFWTSILVALIFTEKIYTYLFSNNLTSTEPLSLFDVIQITGIVLVLYIANKAYAKAETLEKRLQDLHQEVSIVLSEKNGKS